MASSSAAQSIPPRLLIETIAGNGRTGDLPELKRPALTVPVDLPFGVEVGPDGGLFLGDTNNHRVRWLHP
ncbi:MAG: hypothetical protein HY288_05200 [Planctomycetia bacterium]|nr:hypothetical protein [Planctomycetia bacterium]